MTMKQKTKQVGTPESVNILGKTYAIEWLPHIYEDDGEQSGMSSTRHQVIKISTSHHKEQQKDTLLHEMLHAVDEEIGTKLEEEQVRHIATCLFQVLNSNPNILEFLFT